MKTPGSWLFSPRFPGCWPCYLAWKLLKIIVALLLPSSLQSRFPAPYSLRLPGPVTHWFSNVTAWWSRLGKLPFGIARGSWLASVQVLSSRGERIQGRTLGEGQQRAESSSRHSAQRGREWLQSPRTRVFGLRYPEAREKFGGGIGMERQNSRQGLNINHFFAYFFEISGVPVVLHDESRNVSYGH